MIKKKRFIGIVTLGFLLTLISQVSWAQQVNVQVLDNQTLPGMTLVYIRVTGTIPQDTTALFDLYVDYDGDLNYKMEEQI